MLKNYLDQAKNEEAVVAAGAMGASVILHQMQNEIGQLPEEEVWGKHGLVHNVLNIIFDIFNNLGRPVPHSNLKKAYEMVDTMMQQNNSDEQVEQPQMQQPGLMGAMPNG